MIPEEHKTALISNGLSFIRAVTEAYGAEKGMELWEEIAKTLDPELKGQIFFSMLTGNYGHEITLKGVQLNPTYKKINAIKAVRVASQMGLKDAKDLVEAVEQGYPKTLTIVPGVNRNVVINDLRSFGIIL